MFFSGDGEKINFEQETRPQQEECRLKVKLERTFAKFEVVFYVEWATLSRHEIGMPT